MPRGARESVRARQRRAGSLTRSSTGAPSPGATTTSFAAPSGMSPDGYPQAGQTLVSARGRSRSARSAKSLLESRVVAYGGEVVVSARVLAEPREQLDGPSEVGERVVAGVARERCEARVVVMQARVVRRVLEATADRFERVGVPLLAVGGHGLSVERPRLTPVDPLVRLV